MKMNKILDIPQNDPCLNCNTCIRLRLMEMGFIKGQNIEIEGKAHGLYKVRIVDENGITENKIALRQDEFERICFV